jgi:hypothetical protein
MRISKKAITDFWYITYNDSNKYFYGKIDIGTELHANKEYYEEFDNEADYLARCEELNIEVDDE